MVFSCLGIQCSEKKTREEENQILLEARFPLLSS